MVQTSLSTVMMAVITTNVFLILLSLCLINKKLLLRAGYRLLALFALFTTLRFVLPIELPFTLTIKFPYSISQIIARCHDRLFHLGGQSISLWQLFEIFWLIGFIIAVAIHLFSYYRSSRYIILYGKELTQTAPYKELLDEICVTKNRANTFRVIELPGLDIPVLFGLIHPRILIPEHFAISEQNMSFILQHEATHHFKHDLWLKNIIRIITLAYWWDPFSWLLNHQADVILEMRIDDALTNKSTSIAHDYMQCLIDVSELAVGKTIVPNHLTMGLFHSKNKDLKHRFQLMMSQSPKSSNGWSILLVSIACALYLFSYSFVAEGYTPPQECITDENLTDSIHSMNTLIFPNAQNSYFIDNEDGTYDFYLNSTYWETVDCLDYYSEAIPVYTKDTAPQ